MSKYTFSPSILSANLACLQQEVDSVATADALHIDVMDGHFVPNLSFGAPVVECINTRLPLDIHLMVANPEERIEEFLSLKVASITFHIETIDDPSIALALIAAIKDGGAKAGIAIKPNTNVSALEGVLPEIDMVTVMTVQPGFGGQQFIEESLAKVQAIRSEYPFIDIQVDGGVSIETLPQCIMFGATNFVVGSALFTELNQSEYISKCRALYEN